MKKQFLLRAIFIAVLMLTCASQAGAEQYAFTFSGQGTSGAGTLSAVDNGDGTSTITAGSITVSGYGTMSIRPTGDMTLGYTRYQYDFQGGTLIFDYNNILYSSNPYFDNYGMMFTNGLVMGEGGLDMAIWYADESYQILLFENWGHYAYGPISFDLSAANAVPEPATMLLLGLGLAGAAVARRKLTK